MSSRKSLSIVIALLLATACREPPPDPIPGTERIVEGRRLFFEETFGGNGRTCGTCHPARNNFTIDPTFVAKLPPDDPLFIADTTPDLGHRFENNKLIRGVGLILENLDGFADLENVFTQRGVPHTLALRLSVASPRGPQTGWSGDGAPGDRSLRSFATGAVIQHFTKTVNRVPGVDFRLPTDTELDALDAFQLALGRQEELALPLRLRSTVALRGQAIFNSGTEGKCSACHFNAGANGSPQINALENIRQSMVLLQARVDSVLVPTEDFTALLSRAQDEINDAIIVLEGGGLHPDAAARLVEGRRLIDEASGRRRPADLARQAIAELERARGLIIETS
jgi:mono/diheme cytochrome c family protein